MSVASHPFAAAPSQLPNPAAQVTTSHTDETQATALACDKLQTLPQPPQLRGSKVVFVHVPRQLVIPVWHDTVHMPLVQTLPLGHVAPHALQFELSRCVSRHVPEQFVCPVGHEIVSSGTGSASAAVARARSETEPRAMTK